MGMHKVGMQGSVRCPPHLHAYNVTLKNILNKLYNFLLVCVITVNSEALVSNAYSFRA
jgi:hypothetical protein